MFEKNRLHTWDMFEDNQKRLHTWDMFEKNQKRLHLGCLKKIKKILGFLKKIEALIFHFGICLKTKSKEATYLGYV